MAARFVRLALRVVMQNEGDFLDVILLYMPGNRMALRLEGNIEKYARVAEGVCQWDFRALSLEKRALGWLK